MNWLDWILVVTPALGLLLAFLVTDFRERKARRRSSARQWLRSRADFYRRLR